MMESGDGGAHSGVLERMLLSELVRIGVGRMEDLKLLQSVLQEGTYPPQVAQQLMKECSLREEWRCSKEADTLARILNSGLVSCRAVNETGMDQPVLDQLRAIQQIREEQHQMALMQHSRQQGQQQRKIAAAGVGSKSKGSATASTTSRQARPSSAVQSSSSTQSALALYGSMGRGMQKSDRALAPSKVPGLSPYAAGGAKPRAALQPSPQHTPSWKGPIAAPLRSESSGDRQPAPSQAVGNHRPTSAPDEERSGQHVGSPAALANVGKAPPGFGAGADVRFTQLYRLQQTLHQGLSEHKASDGVDAATSALTANLEHARAFFKQCLDEATAFVSTGSGVASRYSHWANFLQLGQLGLTTTDIARLRHLRATAAARTIQHAVRRFLKLRRQQRALEKARKHQAAMRLKLRMKAATIIQSQWRAHMARKKTSIMRQCAREQRQLGILQALRCKLAAIRIQRAYRRYRKKEKLKAVLQGTGSGNPGPSGKLAGQATGPPHAHSPAPSSSKQVGTVKAAEASRSTGGTGTTPPAVVVQYSPQEVARREKAVVHIQACLRGWQVRRGVGLWWHQQVMGLHGRRAAARQWKQHQAFMDSTYTAQAQLVEGYETEAKVHEAASAEVVSERQEFEAAWSNWLGAQYMMALDAPLPRGWMPHVDPSTGSTHFLNTKTGELHLHHPGVHQLQGFVTAQRESAERSILEREARVATYLQQVHSLNVQGQMKLLHEMGDALAQGGGKL